ncbi:MAG: glucan biosynthesis protein D [Gammaproteobacteria bacterium]|nr:glucan biosynthesis protein D [Gammaproteobacteria bacterium]
MRRREALIALLALAAGASGVRAAGLEAPSPFDFAVLKGRADALARAPYDAFVPPLPAALEGLDFDRYQAVRYRPEQALWHHDQLGLELRFFHPGFLFKRPVQLHEVVAGEARAIAYEASRFDFGGSGVVADALPPDLGYAGFRLVQALNQDTDMVAFLGASYFRAVGVDKQYGLSARGLAIDTGLPRPEEFPDFTNFWFERPSGHADHLVVYALLDSPSCAGAYRFDLQLGPTLVMDIDVALFLRKPIERLGLAPLTSMYQTGENDRRLARDFRPEIHDSDGLAIITGSGESLWRPLENPRGLRFNQFIDRNPRGFGLLQRDRNFDHYQDDGVFYERRPSVWIEPKGDWGAGAVTLVELPTNDETFDNIVVFWTPEKPLQVGQEFLFGYRAHWGREPPRVPKVASVAATRTGLGGVVGQARSQFSWRFVLDFSGGQLPLLPRNAPIELRVSATRGKILLPSVRPLDAVNGFRAIFDLQPDASLAPIDLRAQIVLGAETLSETWLYQYSPPPLAERA